MPWLSPRSPSPALSPATGPPAKGGNVESVVYIPPLIDGACGTALRVQQPPLSLLRADASAMMQMMPQLFWALWAEFVANGGTMTWADRMDILTHVALVVIEVYMLVAVLPLWLILPGVLFAAWLCGCVSLILSLSWLLHGKQQAVRCTAGSEGWMMGQEVEDEKWIVVEGMGISSRHFGKSTLPALSKLFSRTMTGICMPSYGVPVDLLTLLLHRCMTVPSQPSRIIHSHLRAALLDSSINRVVVLAHNLGSATVAQVTGDLCADIPADKLSKLEIYTFGAAASEFVLPTGESSKLDAPSLPQQDGHLERGGRGAPHVEHFALANDPLARLGVLHSVRQDLQGRFCGGVFIIDGAQRHHSTSTPSSSSQLVDKTREARRPSGLSLIDYMTALFPAQMTEGAVDSGALDGIMAIDRDVAEKREFAAMSGCAAAAAARPGSGGKRLSWTGLGATVGQTHRNGGGGRVMDGVVGLEMARRGCKDCDGHRGREVSWLVRYVHVGQCVGENEVGVAVSDGLM